MRSFIGECSRRPSVKLGGLLGATVFAFPGIAAPGEFRINEKVIGQLILTRRARRSAGVLAPVDLLWRMNLPDGIERFLRPGCVDFVWRRNNSQVWAVSRFQRRDEARVALTIRTLYRFLAFHCRVSVNADRGSAPRSARMPGSLACLFVFVFTFGRLG